MDSVSLKDFVAETLKSISVAVREAQEFSKEKNSVPIAVGNLEGKYLASGEQLVKFTVSLQAERATEKGASASVGATLISVVTGKLDATARASASENHVHTVEFSVPVSFNAYWNQQGDK